MPDAVIVGAVHTPRGKRKGSLSMVHPMDLAAVSLNGLIERTGIDPKEVEDVILGCVTQTGEQGQDIARTAVLAAGWPIDVTGVALNRFCGSAQQAVNFAAQGVMSGTMDCVVGGGVESMTRVAMASDFGPPSDKLMTRFPDLVPQGLSAEMVADKWNLSREDLDRFAYRSQQNAKQAWEEGRFKNEIIPVEAKQEDGSIKVVDRDEHMRPATTLEKMATLAPSFNPDGKITAGNSSGIVDGASALLICSPEKAKALGLRPRARFVTMALAGSEPVIMLTGPIPSSKKALTKAGLKASDIDLWEINEAFAPVPLVVAKEVGIDIDRVNVNGGAIALGHPLGATGGMLLSTLLNELERQKKRLGAVTMCMGYGMGITTIIERVEG